MLESDRQTMSLCHFNAISAVSSPNLEMLEVPVTLELHRVTGKIKGDTGQKMPGA